jgi:FkbH-like protein
MPEFTAEALEAVRLVVWDLDEIFWDGTLAEEGVRRYRQDNHDLVVTLARRGIISAICSKNDRARAEAMLRESGIWDYFVFPSIEWSPKGARLAALIEQMKLRPANVLFIDDHPSNLAEAAALIPDLQLADTTAAIDLGHRRFRGQEDGALTRLAHYRLMEARAGACDLAGQDNLAFLRASDIRITIDNDVVGNLDRAIELINRTNQLNFTKRRLPEDLVLARGQLLEQLRHHRQFAGLVHLRDRYGDYGAIGFFMGRDVREDRALEHFCFSCRTLGIGVERWVYNRLGRPKLQIAGEVVGDLSDTTQPDWIHEVFTPVDGDEAPSPVNVPQRHLRFYGGCELAAVAHYLPSADAGALLEVNRDWRTMGHYRNNSRNLAAALQQTGPACRFFEAMDLTDLFHTDAFAPSALPSPVVVSLWADIWLGGWRHCRDGFVIGLEDEHFHLIENPQADVIDMFQEAGRPEEHWPFLERLMRRLAADFEAAGLIEADEYKQNLRTIFAHASARMPVVLLLQPELWRHGREGEVVVHARAVSLRQWSRETAAEFEHVHLLDAGAHISSDDDVDFGDHLDRRVYYRIHQELMSLLARI